MKLKTLPAFLLCAVALLGGAIVFAPIERRAAAQEGTQSAEVQRITVDELKAMLAENKPVTIIDVRSPLTYDATDTKIKNAIRIPLDEIEARLKEIPRDREIVTYCT